MAFNIQHYSRTAGSTSNTFEIAIADSSTTTGGGALTGLVFNTSNLTCYYSRDGAASVAVSMGTQTVTGAWSSGGFVEIDATNFKGMYRLDLPNAALAAGVKCVTVLMRGATNMIISVMVIELKVLDDQDGVRAALTSLPNAAAGASNGLPLGDASGRVDVGKLLGTAWLTPGTAGTPDVNVKLWNALTTVALPLVPTTAGRTLDVSSTGEAGVDWANVGSPTTTLDLSNTTIKTTQKVDVDTIKTNPVVNGGTITFPTTATLASTTNITAGTIGTATNVTTVNGIAAGAITAAAIADAAIDRATFAADTGLQSVRSSTAQAGASTTITLDSSASATTDFYKYCLIYLTGGTGVGQHRLCTAYNGGTKVATITPAWATNPDVTSTFAVAPRGIADLETILGVAVSTSTAQLGVNAVNIGGTAQTGRDIGASVLLSNGTGTGQLKLASGYVAMTWADVAAPTTTLALTGTTIATTQKVDIETIKTNPVVNAGTVTFPTMATLASTTNIAAGTIGTVTNLTNAPTSGDLTATMKTSVTTACTASTPTAAAVTGAVGSVTAAVTLSAGDSPVLQSGTAGAGGASTITIQTALGADSLPLGCTIKITSGTGAKQARVITGYVDSTKVVAVDRAWVTNPDSTSVYSILYTEAPALSSGLKVTGVVTTDTASALTTNNDKTGYSLAASQHVIVDSGTVTTVTNQLTAAQVATGIWQDTTAGDFTTALSIGKSIMNGVALGTGLTVARCTLTDTLTTYTGNTVQTGDAYAQTNSGTFGLAAIKGYVDDIGVAGAGLTAIPTIARVTLVDTSTALTNAPTAGDFTATMKMSLNAATPTLSAGDSPVMQSGTASAGGASAITIQTALGTTADLVGCKIKITSGTGANQERIITGYVNGTKVVTVNYAWVTNPSSDSVYSILFDNAPKIDSSLKISGVVLADTLTTYTSNTPQTGDSFARIGAAGVSLSAIPDLAGVTTLLARLTSTRAGYLDNLSAGAVALASVCTDARLAHLDADVTSRMATYTQPIGFLAANFSTGIPVSGDLSSTMKTSVQTAADAAITANALVLEIEADTDTLTVGVNVTQVSGTTQTAGDIIAAVSNIAVTSAALNTTTGSRTITTGTGTGGVGNTTQADGVYDNVADVAGTVDFYYEFDISGTSGAVGVGVQWLGYVVGAVNTVKVYARNWNGSSWDQIGTIVGIAGTVNMTDEWDLTSAHTSAGLVRIRFAATGLVGATVKTDRILLGYAVVTTFPTNFASLAIDGSGRVDLGEWLGIAPLALSSQQVQAVIPATSHVIVDSGTMTNLTNLPAVPTDWLTGAGVKADAVTKIQAGLATPTNITAGTITTVSGNVSGNLVGSIGSLAAQAKADVNAEADTALADVGVTTTVTGRIDAAVTTRAPSATALSTANYTSARAGYLDNLNVGGAVASQADVNAINQSASKHLLLATVGQYERPESGTTLYTVEARTFVAATGAAVNADSTPTLTATGQTSGSLSVNLSAATNPATGVYRWTYTVTSTDTTEPIRFDVSATISSATFTLSAFSQVVDLVSVTWNSTDASHLTAIYNKLPSSGIADETLVLTAIAGVQSDTDDIQARLPATLVGGKMDSAPVTLADGVAHGGTLGSSTATLAFSRIVGQSQASNTPAFSLTGNGSGAGFLSVGGATNGKGMWIKGGGDDGCGLVSVGAGGDDPGTKNLGVYFGGGSDFGDGMQIAGGPNGGKGVLIGAGHGNDDQGLVIVGDGSAPSVHILASNQTAPGIWIQGGGTSGDGILITTTDGHGVNVAPVGTGKHGILSTGGTNGDGFHGVGAGTGVGFSSTPEATGFGGAGDVTLAASQPNYAPAKAGDAMTLTVGERDSVATALLDLAAALDGKTPREALRFMAAIIGGLVSGAGTGSETFKGLDDTTTRAVVTVDSNGNRTGISRP